MKRFIPFACALLLTACASMQPADLSKRLYEIDVAVKQSEMLANDLRDQALISDQDWPKVQAGFLKVSDGLKTAWAQYKENPQAAADSLKTIEGAFAEVQTILIPVQQRVIETKP